MVTKRLLFLRATEDYAAELVGHIMGVCGLLGIEFVEHAYTSVADFKSFCRDSAQFDFLYVDAHGNHSCFGEATPVISTRWVDFGVSLCETQVMNPGSVIFMGCCHGGLKRVALILFTSCPQIVSVCGPKWTISGHQVAVGIHVFLYNLIIAEEEPLEAAARTACAIGTSFPFYDRYELEADITIMERFAPLNSDYTPTEQLPPVSPPSPNAP